MNKLLLILLLVSVFLISHASTQSGWEQKKKYDESGRLTQILYYINKDLKSTEKIYYSGKNTNPNKIVYENISGLESIPEKEINYDYSDNKVSLVQFYTYKEGKRVQEGQIQHSYLKGRLSQTKYYKRLKPSKRIFMFALQHYTYSGENLKNRRFIQFEINPDTLKPMQSCQYVIYYKKSHIESMRSSIMDSTSKKIIEKKEEDITIINKLIEEIEKSCITKASGKGFIKF